MKIKYEAPNGKRFHSYFRGFTTFEWGWWYNEDLHIWELDSTPQTGCWSTHQRCRTLKAFIRKLKKAPHRVKFVLQNKYVGYNVYGEGEL